MQRVGTSHSMCCFIVLAICGAKFPMASFACLSPTLQASIKSAINSGSESGFVYSLIPGPCESD